MESISHEFALPPAAWRHYRHFSWVIYEQRLLVLVLGGATRSILRYATIPVLMSR